MVELRDKDHVLARALWSNTAKDGSGTPYQILLDSDGHPQVDVLSMPTITETNSAAMLTALQIIDDWDEGDKAAVVLYGFDDPTYRKLVVNASGHLVVYTP